MIGTAVSVLAVVMVVVGSSGGIEPVKFASPVGPGVTWTETHCKHPGFREPVCYTVTRSKHPGIRAGGIKPVKCTTRDCQAPPRVSQSLAGPRVGA